MITEAEIERIIAAEFPVMPGEKKCAFERRKMNELRNWKRIQLRKQNTLNEQSDTQPPTSVAAPK